MPLQLLTVNTGSSSLKAALYEVASEREARPVVSAQAERIGSADARLRIMRAGDEATAFSWEGRLVDHAAALQMLLDWLTGQHIATPDAIGHRVVYGGSRYREPRLITDELVAALQALVPVDPDHLPQALRAIDLLARAYPNVPQVACFDTAFHRQMPRVAQMYALPRQFWEDGVIRFGFHGLSYEYIVHELRRLEPVAGGGRLVVAHLGSGASMAAIRDGASVDTTMGFTPAGGLMMSTRSGDLDPGVLLYLLQERGLSPAALSDLVNRQSGLLGVSETSADMQALLQQERADPRAAEAIDLFCYQARKCVGALAAVLGGLDTLVFTAGIGEHAAAIRARICAGLEFLGVLLDPDRNAAHAPIISRDGGSAVVRVLRTDEDVMIARHTYRLIAPQGGDHVSRPVSV